MDKNWIDIWENNEWMTDFIYPSRMALTFYQYHLKNKVEINSEFYLVDAGCGSLGNTKFFIENKINVIGVDIFNKSNYINDKFKFIKSRLDNIELVDSSVDAYFSDGVLYYGDIFNFRKCCIELKRILKKNGIFRFNVKHIMDTLFNNEFTLIEKNNFYTTIITKKGWENGLKIIGFNEDGLKNEIMKLFPDYNILIGQERFHYTTTKMNYEHYFLIVTGFPKINN